MTAPSRIKPRLRGVSHQVAAMISAPAVALLWLGAGTGSARLGAAVYGASLVVLFSISAFYHRPTWPPLARDWIGRLDHSAIFLLIAGTYTPFGLLLGPAGGTTLLAVVWGGALLGVLSSLVWPDAPKPLRAALYVALGWTFLAKLPALLQAAGPLAFGLLFAGGVVYTAGALVFALQRPDPFPRVFGYHEIFHLLVVVAAALHFAAVSLTLPALA
jgi:hemolysin III